MQNIFTQFSIVFILLTTKNVSTFFLNFLTPYKVLPKNIVIKSYSENYWILRNFLKLKYCKISIVYSKKQLLIIFY